MPEEKEQFTKEEEIIVKETVPDPNPGEIVTTDQRKPPLKRHLTSILSETHGQTTEANRFKED